MSTGYKPTPIGGRYPVRFRPYPGGPVITVYGDPGVDIPGGDSPSNQNPPTTPEFLAAYRRRYGVDLAEVRGGWESRLSNERRQLCARALEFYWRTAPSFIGNQTGAGNGVASWQEAEDMAAFDGSAIVAAWQRADPQGPVEPPAPKPAPAPPAPPPPAPPPVRPAPVLTARMRETAVLMTSWLAIGPGRHARLAELQKWIIETDKAAR